MFFKRTEAEIPIPFSDELQYRYVDASVPPEYHRSYTITVQSCGIRLTVDAYGKVLKDETYSITNAAFLKFVQQMDALDLRTKEDDGADACVGGTSERYTIVTGNKNIIAGHVYYCGGKVYGNMEGELKEVAALFRQLVPGWKGKLKG